MRELKFRAWDQERGVMVYGQDIEEYEDELDEVSYTYHAPRYSTGLSYGTLFVAYTSKSGDFTECEVMQFTGLLDKNGREIYEGDILLDGEGLCVAIWDRQGSWGASIVEECGSYYGSEALLSEWHGGLEVVGNIYEHPHLLQS